MNKAINMKYFLLSILLMVSSQSIYSQSGEQTFDKISKTFLKNDYKSLGSHFANTLDLIIETNDGTFGKQQALMILKEFFEKNKISYFKIKHNGSSNERTYYAVCDMSNSNKSWSVYILLNTDSKIIQLQIEE